MIKIKKFLTNFLLCSLVVCSFLVMTYYGMGKEIERREAETAYHVQRCESDKNYYPEFCAHLLGEK